MGTQRGFGRGMAAMAGGLALGVVGGRLLPPLLASATGSVGARLGRDPFGRLKQDHARILSTLDRMIEAPEDSKAQRGWLFLALKRTLGKHAMAEEDVVYPLLHRHAEAAEAVQRLYAEHAQMKIALHELEEALKTGAPWTERVRSLRSLIERHVRDEEDVEFPKLQSLMDEGLRRSVSGQIQREKAMIV